ncbi:hypothetical protein [Planococcus sp. ISL-109]|uniref:hypothetical protein n=1 Tax=Planococcus sp. ISL-109 TaxID=2819166 RepID=UPI001BEA6C00|nr:hypothetical protein [Planococcus sp. ISL-109]MBT2581230.1 hypothetical protein [Planococcus sp. ISL-109]
MYIIAAVIFLQALITFILKGFVNNSIYYSLSLLGIFIIIMSIYILIKFNGKLFLIIYFGFLIRVIILLIDIFIPSISIFGSGTDTEYFHNTSLEISKGNMPLSEGRTFYVSFLSAFYYFFGNERILAQFINVILWVFSSYYLMKTLQLFSVSSKHMALALSLFTFFPNLIFMTSVLLRESWIIFSLTLSLYYFILWYKEEKNKSLLLAVMFSLLAMLFHAGMIGILISYLLIVVLNQKKIDLKKLFFYLLLILSLTTILLTNENMFLSKFLTIQESGIDSVNLANEGNSAYLQSFNYLNSWLVFLLTPLKIIYFLLSPLPMDWRGIGDIISFGVDSLIYFLLIILIINGFLKSSLSKKYKIMFFILLITSVFIFAYGTGNAGTAIRHRTKLLPLFIVSWVVLSNHVSTTTKNKLNSKKM